MYKGPALALLCALASVLSGTCEAAVLAAGTNIEVRLQTATGSRISHPGDELRATVIAPVYERDRLVIPPGAVISGVVDGVDRLGFGVKHPTARIRYRFTSLQLPDGAAAALPARTVEVETARERVTEGGDIRGINPDASLSSGASILISALIANVEFAVPAMGVKFLIARSPDAEIYFPAGTELILESTAEARIPDLAAPPLVHELDSTDDKLAQMLLAKLPQQQTFQTHNRPSDLVNMLVLGTREQVDRAFHAAGWYGEQHHSALALYRMYHCLVQRTGYTMAPMARLRLNGQLPDSVYQKSLDTFAKRHHIRLWRQHDSDAWIGATTEDVSYTIRHMHVTHATDSEIDNERAKVVNDLWLTGCVSAASMLRRDRLRVQDSPGFPINTDGEVAVLKLNDCRTPQPTWMAATEPAAFRRYPFSQMFVAVGNDLARSNPVTLAYTFTKSIFRDAAIDGVHGFRSQPRGMQSNNPVLYGLMPWRWKRPSITDPEMAASPTLTAKNIR